MKIWILTICCLMFGFGVVCGQEIDIYPTPVVEIQSLPAYTVSTYAVPIYKPMVYQWIPQIVHEPVLVQKFGLFGHKTQIIYRPTVRWVYQLSYLP